MLHVGSYPTFHTALSTDRQTSVDFLTSCTTQMCSFLKTVSNILMMQILHHLYFILKARQDEGCESGLHTELDLCPL